MSDNNVEPPLWRMTIAVMLDTLTASVLMGYVAGALTGNLREGLFWFQGWSLALYLGLFVSYFIVGNVLLGDSPWKWFLRRGFPKDEQG